MQTQTPLTKEERQLAWILRVSAFTFSAETLVYLLPALIGGSRETWGELPFVVNSFLKAGLIGGVCFVAAADVRRFERVVSLVVVGLALWVPAGLMMLFFGDHERTVDLAGFDVSMTAIIIGGVVFEGGLARPLRDLPPPRPARLARSPLPLAGPVPHPRLGRRGPALERSRERGAAAGADPGRDRPALRSLPRRLRRATQVGDEGWR